jgi:hypothetical protein
VDERKVRVLLRSTLNHFALRQRYSQHWTSRYLQYTAMAVTDYILSSFEAATMNDHFSVSEGQLKPPSAPATDYVLERYDVICQRGKDCQEHGM